MYYHHQPTDEILGIPISLLGVITTTILGILALFGNRIRNWLFKPNIQPVETKRTYQRYQNASFIYHRLIVKNARKVSWPHWLPNEAKGTRVFLTYRELPVGSGFIPIPLRWTHFNTPSRDIPSGEEVYIDIFGKEENEEKYRFAWAPETGPGGDELDYFHPEYGDIRLEFFDQNEMVGDIYLSFDTKKDTLVLKN